MIEEIKIKEKMKELQTKISYEFKNIDLLARAMNAQKIPKMTGTGKHNDERANAALACLGDAFLGALISEYIYINIDPYCRRRGIISNCKEAFGNNDLLHKIAKEEGILDFSYNYNHFASDPNIPDHEQVSSKKDHCPYIEAIVGAIHLDGDWEVVKEWFENWLLPKLKEYLPL